MKKRYILVSIMVLLLSTLFPVTLKAEAILFDVSFDKEGSAYKINGNDNGEDVYDALKGMQPGDVVDIEFVLKNNSDKKISWWMKNDAVKSFEDDGDAANGAYTYELSLVNSSRTTTVLYSNNEVGGQDSTAGLHEATETLKDDFIFLEEVEGGQEIRIKLHLELEGETQSNSYQEVLAKLQFIFAAEIIESGKTIIYVIPKTGIDAGREAAKKQNSLVMLVSLAFMLLALIYLLMKKKSQRKARNAAVMILFALMLVVPLFTEKVYAAYNTYKVTLLGGNYGEIKDPETGEWKNKVDLVIKAGDPWTSGDYEVRVTNDRYYCNSEFHVSGTEESVIYIEHLNEDMVFVATYRIKGDLVAYTVYYVDENGAELPGLPYATFNGNVGEDAVLAYKYCDGYLPDTYTQTHILDANPDNNVFYFTYHKIPEGEGGTTVIYEEGEPVVTPGGTGGEPGGNVEPVEPVVPDEPVIIDDPTTPQTEPIIDPEPTVVPEPDKPGQLFVPMAIAIGGGLLLLFLFLLLLFRRRRKQEE